MHTRYRLYTVISFHSYCSVAKIVGNINKNFKVSSPSAGNFLLQPENVFFFLPVSVGLFHTFMFLLYRVSNWVSFSTKIGLPFCPRRVRVGLRSFLLWGIVLEVNLQLSGDFLSVGKGSQAHAGIY